MGDVQQGPYNPDVELADYATASNQLPDDHNVQVSNQLVPEKYDYIGLVYTGSNLTTVTFKTGGSGGTTVATLTLAYTGSVLDSVTKV